MTDSTGQTPGQPIGIGDEELIPRVARCDSNALGDLLAAYALDALPDDERLAVLEHLQSCRSCQLDVQRFRSVTEVLEMSVAPETSPSADLRDRILRASARTPQARPIPVAVAWSRRIALTGRLGGWLAAAALFVTSLGLGAWNLSLQQQVQALTARPAPRVALLATADAPGAIGDLALDSGQGAVVTVNNLPQLSPGQVYEAWVIDSAGPQPAGIFLTTPDGRGAISLTRPAAVGQIVAITAEPSPGRSVPSGKVLLKGTAVTHPGA